MHIRWEGSTPRSTQGSCRLVKEHGMSQGRASAIPASLTECLTPISSTFYRTHSLTMQPPSTGRPIKHVQSCWRETAGVRKAALSLVINPSYFTVGFWALVHWALVKKYLISLAGKKCLSFQVQTQRQSSSQTWQPSPADPSRTPEGSPGKLEARIAQQLLMTLYAHRPGWEQDGWHGQMGSLPQRAQMLTQRNSDGNRPRVS